MLSAFNYAIHGFQSKEASSTSWKAVGASSTVLGAVAAIFAAVIIAGSFEGFLPVSALFAAIPGGMGLFLLVDLVVAGVALYYPSRSTEAPGEEIVDRGEGKEGIQETHASNLKGKSIDEIRAQALEYINGLDLPETRAEAMDIDKEKRPYSKEELIEDFNTAPSEDLAEMLEALPHHLFPKEVTASPYPVMGITNFGNTCYINAALQVLTHTPYADYALLRPLRPPTPPNFKRTPPQQVVWDRSTESYAEFSNRKAAIENTHYREIQKPWEDYETALLEHPRSIDRQKAFREAVKRLRNGKTVEKPQILDILRLIDKDLGLLGDPKTDIFKHINAFVPVPYGIVYISPAEVDHDRGIVENSPAPVLVLNFPGHFTVDVLTTEGHYFINDSLVNQTNRTREGIVHNHRDPAIRQKRGWQREHPNAEPIYTASQYAELYKTPLPC